MFKTKFIAALLFSCSGLLAACDSMETSASAVVSPLYKIWGADGSNMWAVGAHGVILKGNGVTWTPEVSGTTLDLTAIWGFDRSNIFAVGHSGTVLRYNGTAWSSSALPEQPCASTIDATVTKRAVNLFGVWGSSPNDVWTVGDCGAVLHFDGTAWLRHDVTINAQPLAEPLVGIWGSSASNVWAVGWNQTIVRFDGTKWAPSVWDHSSDPLAAEILDACQPSDTSLPRLPIHLYRVFGTSDNDVFAVGSCGAILRWDPVKGTWSGQQRKTKLSKANLNGAFGIGRNLWVVGDSGTLLKWNGSAWASLSSGTAVDLNGAWASNTATLWVVGMDGKAALVPAP